MVEERPKYGYPVFVRKKSKKDQKGGTASTTEEDISTVQNIIKNYMKKGHLESIKNKIR